MAYCILYNHHHHHQRLTLTNIPIYQMGSIFSTTSYLQYKNDFELVIRATKDLENLLETQFGAPSGKTVGLHDKITHAEQSAGLSNDTVRKMRRLVTIRNRLVHEHGFNALPDRTQFAQSFDSVEKELKDVLKNRNGSSSCIIC